MEFKLNKVDSDIRERIKESTKTDKIHADKESSMIKQLKDDEERDAKQKDKQQSDSQNQKKRYITIDGVKYYGERIHVDAEKEEIVNELNSKGIMLDVKK